MTVFLEIEDLTGGYGDATVLFDVTCSLESGQILGVLGRNGVGKSTLARLVQGGLMAHSGDVRLKGRSLTKLPAYARRAVGVGYMPQTSMVFDDLSVCDNLNLGQNKKPLDPYFDLFPRLAERLHQKAGTMSGGERKILAFVRSMIEDTRLIVLDEPSEGVQPENISHMARCIKERASDGAGIILCEQNLTLLREVSDSFLGLDTGRIQLRGTADTLKPEDLREFISL